MLGNTKAARGCSRDKRSDCKQLCIGLVCTPEGLPLNYKVFAGNRVDMTTVEDVVRKMEARFGQAERIWVIDRGMASEASIDFLRARKALYIVGTPKAELRHFEAELAEEENWNVVQHGLEARVVSHPDGDGGEKHALCRSQARGEKEKAMLERQKNRLTEELLKIDTALRKSKRKETDLGKRGQNRPGQGRVFTANKLHGNGPRKTGALVHATHPGGGRVPDGEKRHRPAARLSPENRTGGGALVGVLFKPCAVAVVGDVDALQEAWE